MKTYVSQPVRDNHVIDYFSVVRNFQMNTRNVHSPGYGKFNNQHLQNRDFIKGIINKISNTIVQFNITSHRIIWEFIEYNIKQDSISYTSTLSKNNRENINKIQKELDNLNLKILHSTENNHEQIFVEKRN